MMSPVTRISVPCSKQRTNASRRRVRRLTPRGGQARCPQPVPCCGMSMTWGGILQGEWAAALEVRRKLFGTFE